MNLDSQQLFSFDLNFDSLKRYLNSIAKTINQHANLINLLQNEVQNKILTKVIPDNYKCLHEGMNFANNEMVQNLKKDLGKSLKAENNPQTQELNKLSNKLAMLTSLASTDSIKTKAIEQKLNGLEELISEFASKDEVKEKHSKLKTSLNHDIDEIKNYCDKKMFDLEKKLHSQLNSYDDKIGGVEKNTLWRIQDCEEIVKKRVTQEYVDNSLNAFQEKVIRDMKASTAGDSERMDSIQQDILFKIKVIQENTTEKQNSLKQYIKDTDEKQVYFMGMLKENFEDFKKLNNNNLNEISKRLKEVEKSNEFQQDFERLQSKVKYLEDCCKQIIQDSDKRFNELMVNGFGKPAKKEETGPSWASPHKICEIESNIKRGQTENKRLREEYEEYKKATDMRLEHMQMSQYEKDKQVSIPNIGKYQLSKNKQNKFKKYKFKKEMIIKEFKEQINEKISKIDDGKQYKLEIDKLNKKIDSFKELERRVQKLMRDIDINGMIKQIRSKAEGDDVLKDFAVVDTKINNNSEAIGFIRKDIDNILVLYKKMLQQVQTSSTSSDNNQMAIISTKKLHSIANNNCLSCGNQKKQVYHKIASSQIKLKTEPCNISTGDINAMTATGCNFNNQVLQRTQRSESNSGKRSDSASKLRPFSARK